MSEFIRMADYADGKRLDGEIERVEALWVGEDQQLFEAPPPNDALISAFELWQKQRAEEEIRREIDRAVEPRRGMSMNERYRAILLDGIKSGLSHLTDEQLETLARMVADMSWDK